MSRARTSTLDQFRRKYEVSADGCWLWLGAINHGGYALFTPCHDGKALTSATAHRWAYTHLVGPVPDGLVLDHLCRVRHCVNPAHLEPVTQAENVHRGAAYTKTHCKHGHEYTPENTGQQKGGRYCRACKVNRGRADRERARAAA